MNYLELLKSENAHTEALPKPPKGGSVSFGSTTKRAFSQKRDDSDLDPAERIFNFLACQGRACSDAEIMADLPGDEAENRNILSRMVAEEIIGYLGKGRYRIGAPMPELPAACPLRTGGKVPKGCGFHPRLFARMLETGTLTIGGSCPLVRVCNQ